MSRENFVEGYKKFTSENCSTRNETSIDPDKLSENLPNEYIMEE